MNSLQGVIWGYVVIMEKKMETTFNNKIHLRAVRGLLGSGFRDQGGLYGVM